MNPDDSLFSHPVEQTYTYNQSPDTENSDGTDTAVAHPVFSDRDR